MNIYYVYGHYANSELVYIGKGTDNRAWSSKRFDTDHENWAREQIMTNRWGSCVRILLPNLSSKAARAEEKKLIEAHQPKWNSECNDHICELCGYTTRSVQGLTAHKRYRH